MINLILLIRTLAKIEIYTYLRLANTEWNMKTFIRYCKTGARIWQFQASCHIDENDEKGAADFEIKLTPWSTTGASITVI